MFYKSAKTSALRKGGTQEMRCKFCGGWLRRGVWCENEVLRESFGFRSKFNRVATNPLLTGKHFFQTRAAATFLLRFG